MSRALLVRAIATQSLTMHRTRFLGESSAQVKAHCHLLLAHDEAYIVDRSLCLYSDYQRPEPHPNIRAYAIHVRDSVLLVPRSRLLLFWSLVACASYYNDVTALKMHDRVRCQLQRSF
ncbi:hypothetical protein BVI434_1660034 [Burkholderia vietnamiensis]|nr:hypothetical protein BVI434_1660034 [Burkholderia vietnamiensis]